MVFLDARFNNAESTTDKHILAKHRFHCWNVKILKKQKCLVGIVSCMAENRICSISVAQFHGEVEPPLSATVTLKSLHIMNFVSLQPQTIIVFSWRLSESLFLVLF